MPFCSADGACEYASMKAGPIRAAVALFAGLFALSGVPVHAQAPSETDPTAILAKVMERNPNLNSYQGRLHVDVQLKTFPFLNVKLDGTTYFKKPANYEVVFDRVPTDEELALFEAYLRAQEADELATLRKAADEVLRAYMPQFPDSRAVDDCLVALAAARCPRGKKQ